MADYCSIFSLFAILSSRPSRGILPFVVRRRIVRGAGPAILATACWVFVCLIPGCSDTAIHLIIHSKLKIPDQVDALCLQIAAGGELDFSRRYPLSESHAGRPMTTSVLPGEQHKDGFEVLLRGDRRGLKVSWLRESAYFESNAIKEKHLFIERCGGGAGQGRFSWAGRLTDRPEAAVEGIPVPMASSLVLVVSAQQAKRFAFIGDQVMDLEGGLPSPPGAQVGRLLAADLDGDCDLDLIVLNKDRPHMWRHDGKGEFHLQSNAILVVGEFKGGAIADMNLDGYADLVLGATDKTKLLLNNGKQTGTFRDAMESLPADLQQVTSVGIGFINRDSYPDIVLARGESTAEPNVVLISQYSADSGRLGFNKVEYSEPKQTKSVTVADVDGDGWHDVIDNNVGEPPAVLLNRSSGKDVILQVRTGALDRVGGEITEEILAVDLDDDCDQDLVVARSSGIRILLNDGTASFSEHSSGAGLPGGKRVAASDVDGDGALDVIVGGNPSGAGWLHQGK